MKKIVRLIVLLSILLALDSQAFAYTQDLADAEVSPMYIHLMTLSSSLDIDKLGIATCTAKLVQNLGDGSSELIMNLQKLNSDNTWSSVHTWTKTGLKTCSDSQYKLVSKGTYRLFVTGKIYDSDGKFVEAGTIYSINKTY